MSQHKEIKINDTWENVVRWLEEQADYVTVRQYLAYNTSEFGDTLYHTIELPNNIKFVLETGWVFGTDYGGCSGSYDFVDVTPKTRAAKLLFGDRNFMYQKSQNSECDEDGNDFSDSEITVVEIFKFIAEAIREKYLSATINV